MRGFSSKLLLICALAIGAGAASAQTAHVYAVHGIPGINGFPVDVEVDGTCVLKGFTFGTVAGPLSLTAGPHTVAIYGANTTMPCTGSPALSASPNVAAGRTYALVAHLTENAALTLSGFMIDLSQTRQGTGRFIFHHTAAAPCVDVHIARGGGQGNAPAVPVSGFCNGAQVPAQFRPGDWQVTLAVNGSVVFGPDTLTLAPRTAQLVFAVGVFPSSFTYIVKTIPIY